MPRPPSGKQHSNQQSRANLPEASQAVTEENKAEILNNAIQPTLFDGPEHAEARKILAQV